MWGVAATFGIRYEPTDERRARARVMVPTLPCRVDETVASAACRGGRGRASYRSDATSASSVRRLRYAVSTEALPCTVLRTDLPPACEPREPLNRLLLPRLLGSSR